MRVIAYDLSTGNFEYAIPPEEFRDAETALAPYPDGTKLSPTVDSQIKLAYRTTTGTFFTLSGNCVSTINAKQIEFRPTENRQIPAEELNLLAELPARYANTFLHQYCQRRHGDTNYSCYFFKFNGKVFALNDRFASGSFGLVRWGTTQTNLTYAFKFPHGDANDLLNADEIKMGKEAGLLIGETQLQPLPDNTPPQFSSHRAIVANCFPADLYELAHDLKKLKQSLLDGGKLSTPSEINNFNEEILRILNSIFLLLSQELVRLKGLAIIHRDIKPANILVRHKWSNQSNLSTLTIIDARLTDYGFAVKSWGGKYTGGMAGSHGYLPPEAKTTASTVIHASDLFALGESFRKVAKFLDTPLPLQHEFLITRMTQTEPTHRFHLSYVTFVLAYQSKNLISSLVKTEAGSAFLNYLFFAFPYKTKKEFADDFWMNLVLSIELHPDAQKIFSDLRRLYRISPLSNLALRRIATGFIAKLYQGIFSKRQHNSKWIKLLEVIQRDFPQHFLILVNPKLFVPADCLEMKLNFLYRILIEKDKVPEYKLHEELLRDGTIVNSDNADGLLTSMTDYIFPVISPRVTGAGFYLASRAEPDYIKALKLKRNSAKKDDNEVSVTCS